MTWKVMGAIHIEALRPWLKEFNTTRPAAGGPGDAGVTSRAEERSVSAKKATQAWLPRLLPISAWGWCSIWRAGCAGAGWRSIFPMAVALLHRCRSGPEAVLLLRDGKAAKRVATGGGVGFAEGYMAREWDSPDLASLLELVDRNCEAMGFDSRLAGLRRLVERTVHAFRLNSRSGSRKNIQAHYDLGNRFYEAWSTRR